MVTLLWTVWSCMGGDPPLPVMDAPPEVEAPPPPPPPAQAAANLPPRIQEVAIFPKTPTTDSDLRADVTAEDPEGLPVRLGYQWSVNDREILEASGPVLAGSYFEKDDQVRLVVTARDDQNQKESITTLTIDNASPVFETDPRTVSSLDGLKLKVRDPDKDPITYRLEGAPRGMSIDPKAGVLRYQGSVDEPGGQYTLKIHAEDGDGGYATWQLGIAIEPGSGAPPPSP